MRLTTSTERLALPRVFSKTLTSTMVIGALLIVFGLDRATGSAPVQHLYYVPIMLAAFRFGMRGGILAALAAIVLYHLANPHLLTFMYGESDLVQITLFLSVGIVAAKLTQDADHLRRLALTDDLTGLHNLRSFEGHLAAIIHAARVEYTPVALLVLDVDRLKSLNDEHGHLTGAEAVRTVGRIVGRRLPSGAVACRYGGDEFAIAIPRCSSFDARAVAEEWREMVRACAPVLAGRAFTSGTLSISVGGISASFTGGASSRSTEDRDAESGEALFRAADLELYRAKTAGRDRVCVTDGNVAERTHHVLQAST